MDFEGIYLWDARYGAPKAGEDMEAFIEALENLPDAPNPNLQKFGEFIAEFAKQACEFYADPILENYREFSLSGEVEPLLELEIDDMPFNKEVVEHFLAAVFKGAKDNQLIIYDVGAETCLLPSSNEGDVLYANWLKNLKKLKNNEVLPTNQSQLIKLTLKMFKERAKQLGIKLNTNNRGYFSIDLGAINFIFYGAPKIEKNKIYIWPKLDIRITKPQIGKLEISYVKFYQIPYDWHAKTTISKNMQVRYADLLVNDKFELQEIVHNSLDIIMFFYPHCDSLKSLYNFLTTHADDPRLVCGYVRGVEHMAPDILCRLAQLTHQPDYEELEEKYLQQYIENHQYHDYEWQRREALAKGEAFDYHANKKKTKAYLTKEFIFAQEKLKFISQLIDTKEEIINHLKLAYSLGYDTNITKACLETLKISDIGKGPYFVMYGSIYEYTKIDEIIQQMPKGGKLLVIAPWELPEKKALVEEAGGIYLDGGEFL